MTSVAIPKHDERSSRSRARFALLAGVGLVIASVAIYIVGRGLYQQFKLSRAVDEVERLSGVIARDASGEVTNVTFSQARELTDAELAAIMPHLRQFRRLRWLEFQTQYLTDDHVAAIAELQGLETLFLSGASLTDHSAASLASLPNLKSLSLAGGTLTDKGMREIGKLQQLQRLGIESPQVSDAGLQHLQGLGQLQQLTLIGTSTSDAGVQQLADVNCRMIAVYKGGGLPLKLFYPRADP